MDGIEKLAQAIGVGVSPYYLNLVGYVGSYTTRLILTAVSTLYILIIIKEPKSSRETVC